MPDLQTYRTPIEAMTTTLGAYRAGVHGRDIAKILRERYSTDKLTFSANNTYLEAGHLKLAVIHPPTNRTLIATFGAEAGRGWRPLELIKNTFIPSEHANAFVATFADNLMTPMTFESKEEMDELASHTAALLKRQWM